jgi:hypothetical protein
LHLLLKALLLLLLLLKVPLLLLLIAPSLHFEYRGQFKDLAKGRSQERAVWTWATGWTVAESRLTAAGGQSLRSGYIFLACCVLENWAAYQNRE